MFLESSDAVIADDEPQFEGSKSLAQGYLPMLQKISMLIKVTEIILGKILTQAIMYESGSQLLHQPSWYSTVGTGSTVPTRIQEEPSIAFTVNESQDSIF